MAKVFSRTSTSQVGAWIRSFGAVVALFLVNLAMTGLFVALAGTVGWPKSLESQAEVRLAALIAGEAAFFLLLAAWLRWQGASLSDLGFRVRPPAWAWVAAIGFAATYGFLTLSNPGIRQFGGTLGPVRVEAIVAALVAGVVEEAAFRGYVMLELKRAKTPIAAQIVGSGVLFGLAHFNYGLYGLLSATIIGLAFALIYGLGRRSLAPVIAGHAVIDLIIEPGLILWVLAGFPIPQ